MYILLGVIGFISLLIFDYCNLKNYGFTKKISGLGSLGLLVYSGVMILVKYESLELPKYLNVLGCIFTLIWAGMLIYSLFLELPFVNTYGKDNHSSDLVDSGTYALCRHPGVIWFGLMFLSIFLWTGITRILIAGIVWTILDVIHVWLQEKLFFHKIFSEYENYTKRTPMLIPNKSSFKKFSKTVFR